MILLDTNLASEMMKLRPNPAVRDWLARQRSESCFLSSVSEAELRYGVAILDAGRRRENLAAILDATLAEDFAGRILPFDSASAVQYAEIASSRRRAGRPISQFDGQIAAIAKVHGAALATRNVADFVECGIEVIDPWG